MLTTWGLLYALTPIGQLPAIELMNYQPVIGYSDCINQAKPLWYNYYNKSDAKKVQFTTYCFKKKSNDVQFFNIACNQAGVCEERPR